MAEKPFAELVKAGIRIFAEAVLLLFFSTKT
jgi:hypothetical protein